MIIFSLVVIFRKLEEGSLFKNCSIILTIMASAATLMSLNYWFMVGAPSFLPGAQDPTAEGMDIDILMAFITALFIWFNALAWRNALKD